MKPFLLPRLRKFIFPNCHVLPLFIFIIPIVANNLYSSPLQNSCIEINNNAVRRGDANNDGLLNVFDILSTLSQISGKDSLREGSDYDLSGKTDIFDLLGILKELSGFREKSENKLQFLAKIGSNLLTEPIVVPGTSWDINGEVRTKYKIFANREIEDALLIFGTDTVKGLEGTTPLIYKVNPDTIPDSFYANFIITEPIPWKVHVKEKYGPWYADSGNSGFAIRMPNVIVEQSTDILSEKITFPLVLKGAWQRFIIVIGEIDNTDTLLIDLNCAGLDSVVFNSVDSLAAAIMEKIIEYDLNYNDNSPTHLIVGPATENMTKRTTDRLVFSPDFGYIIKLLSSDGNNNLLKLIGFPGWIRHLPGTIINSNYALEQSWREKYQWLLRRHQ
ncbi:MAG: hypothetical protein V1794_00790 [Candidatus Glassbacteria bacterium]